jgi:hypothetical protein
MEFRVREYREEAAKCGLAREAAVEHPLSSWSSREEKEQKKKGGIIARTFVYKQQHNYPTSASSSHIEVFSSIPSPLHCIASPKQS